jgi:ABC-type transporter Mla subunit MlaD
MRPMGREFIVGIVFFLLLGALGTITLVLGADVLKSTEQVAFKFDDVAGLSEGSEVWINGLPAGVVREVTIDRGGIVTASARMRHRVASLDLSRGVHVEIKEKSSLGGTVVAITTLKSKGKDSPTSKEAIEARIWTARAGGFASIGDAAVDKMVEASEETPGFLGKALLGDKGLEDLNGSLAELKKTVESLRTWIDGADRKDSVLAVLLNDPDTGRKVRETVDSIHDITAKANTGQGLLGKLLNDEATSQKFDRILDGLDTFSAGLKNKEGSLYRFMNEGSLFENADKAVADIRKFTDGLNDEKGALHLLVHDEKFAEDLSSTIGSAKGAVEDLRSVLGDVRSGKGTLGKLVNDPALYDDLKGAINSIQRSFEESRENAPILTFAGFLFRAF